MIHIVDYEAGNLTSVKRALDHLGIDSIITQDSNAVREAERIIFPGVGRAGTAMQVLKECGLDRALIDAFSRGTPILGICIGCQIVMTRSEEDDTACLNLMEGTCHRFQPSDPMFKVPHMGWNAIEVVREHDILKDIQPGDEVYFVHSYYPVPKDEDMVYATCTFDINFPAAIGCRNLFSTQFHLEKSGETGLCMLKNFTAWDGDGIDE